MSVGPRGVQAGTVGSVFAPAISAHGRFVAFTSEADNLVPSDNNGVFHTFVRDLNRKVTERVSVGSGGVQADFGSFWPPAISADGRFVAFTSPATNLVLGDEFGTSDTFVRDRKSGLTQWASSGVGGAQGLGVGSAWYP